MEKIKESELKEVIESVHVEGKETRRKRKDSRKFKNHNKLEIDLRGIVRTNGEEHVAESSVPWIY